MDEIDELENNFEMVMNMEEAKKKANRYLVNIKTYDGHIFKILSEYLQLCNKEVCFVVKRDGMSLICTNEGSTIKKIVSLDFKAEYFNVYKVGIPEDESLHIGVNISDMYKMLKSVKKKDILTFAVDKESDLPIKLYLIVKQKGENNVIENTLQVIACTPIKLNHSYKNDYRSPILVSSKEFQKLKNLNKISKYVSVCSRNGLISFYCGKEGLCSKRINFGEEDQEMDEESSYDYREKFETEQIVKLAKLANLSTNIQIFTKEKFPLKFRLIVGNMGEIEIYIKECSIGKNEEKED